MLLPSVRMLKHTVNKAPSLRDFCKLKRRPCGTFANPPYMRQFEMHSLFGKGKVFVLVFIPLQASNEILNIKQLCE
jgi:hypothetical protein